MSKHFNFTSFFSLQLNLCTIHFLHQCSIVCILFLFSLCSSFFHSCVCPGEKKYSAYFTLLYPVSGQNIDMPLHWVRLYTCRSCSKLHYQQRGIFYFMNMKIIRKVFKQTLLADLHVNTYWPLSLTVSGD